MIAENPANNQEQPLMARVTLNRRLVLGSLLILGVLLVLYKAASRKAATSISSPSSVTSPAKSAKRLKDSALKITLNHPVPESKHRLGEPLKIDGTVELPPQYFMFSKQIFIENLVPIKRQRASLFSTAVVLKETGSGMFKFETELTYPQQMPNRAGRYEIKAILTDVELRETATTTSEIPPPIVIIPYLLVK